MSWILIAYYAPGFAMLCAAYIADLIDGRSTLHDLPRRVVISIFWLPLLIWFLVLSVLSGNDEESE